MTRLYRAEILRLLKEDPPLIRNARRIDDGNYDVERDSYDLSAGTAVWKPPSSAAPDQPLSRSYDPTLPQEEQPRVKVEPGQMIFVVTYEEVSLPDRITATVYSRNRLALKGILALNAGHIDPGYTGPIAIRLINLRATPWYLRMGEGIFTIVFDRFEKEPRDQFDDKPITYSKEEMLDRVHETVANSLSNALLDIYQQELKERFSEEAIRLRDRLGQEFVRTDAILGTLVRRLIKNAWAMLIALLVVGSAVGVLIIELLQFLNNGE